MITELLQEQAALYVSGAMSESERERFEIVLESYRELQEWVAGLAETGSALLFAAQPPSGARPSPALKSRLVEKIRTRPQRPDTDGYVRCGPDGLVEWVNPAFSAMCGYTLEEVGGRKLGPILQGEKTDRAAAERMRQAVHEHRPCRETIVNYHKNGTPYWVQIAIEPILNEAGHPEFFVAREREIPELAPP